MIKDKKVVKAEVVESVKVESVKVESVKVETESDKIWNEISNLPINVFAIGGVVADYVKKIELPGAELYLKLGSSAVLPALETTLSNPNITRNKKYSIQTGEGYYVVSRVVDRTEEVQKALKDMARKSKSK